MSLTFLLETYFIGGIFTATVPLGFLDDVVSGYFEKKIHWSSDVNIVLGIIESVPVTITAALPSLSTTLALPPSSSSAVVAITITTDEIIEQTATNPQDSTTTTSLIAATIATTITTTTKDEEHLVQVPSTPKRMAWLLFLNCIEFEEAEECVDAKDELDEDGDAFSEKQSILVDVNEEAQVASAEVEVVVDTEVKVEDVTICELDTTSEMTAANEISAVAEITPIFAITETVDTSKAPTPTIDDTNTY
ncbi:hypothetical protein BDQ12DRAFT_722694 [Crucibulum laeve]|uniref:Uncharacterized protein n=1 Tax=Crucibulum laeve TaxID=68775 RepID=A0A5C3MDX7_9AGAR|nr:hypothetical protein BDQ12DRAFT_722694 [Crucibulum laeve]